MSFLLIALTVLYLLYVGLRTVVYPDYRPCECDFALGVFTVVYFLYVYFKILEYPDDSGCGMKRK